MKEPFCPDIHLPKCAVPGPTLLLQTALRNHRDYPWSRRAARCADPLPDLRRPGRGRVIANRGCHSGRTGKCVVRRLWDYVLARTDVIRTACADGLSFGGYLAPRAARSNPALPQCIATEASSLPGKHGARQ